MPSLPGPQVLRVLNVELGEKNSRCFFRGRDNGDCGHGIKGCLLLGRKVMTNLDSIFKSRDITLSTKDHLVKATVFPLVVYRCESWTINKAES